MRTSLDWESQICYHAPYANCVQLDMSWISFMIFRKGEFVRLIGMFFPFDVRGNVGQIHRVLSLEAVFPYEVVTVSNFQTLKFLCSGSELSALDRRTAEPEISQYLKYVVR